MRVEDWRQLPASLVTPLYDAEVRRWRLALDWDLSTTVVHLEQARASGMLPGFVLRGPGQSIVGWTYFVVQNGTVQIGSLLARTADGLRLLLDAVLKSPDAAIARDVMLFAFPEGAACESALLRRRFDVTRYWYLRRSLSGLDETARQERQGLRLRTLDERDGPDAVRLLSRAYAGQESARCFAPNGRLDEWAYYFAQMTRGNALGTLEAGASLVAIDTDDRTRGLAITTAISDGTLHVAQLVVDPDLHGRGVGGRLLDGTMGWARTSGRRLMTLLVNDDNTAARQLYASRGFLPTGYFLHARRAMLRRTFPMAATDATAARRAPSAATAAQPR